MGLYKRTNSPFWWYTFKHDGKRVQESTGVGDKKQAKDIYHKRRSDYAAGKTLGRQTKLSLKKLLDTYLNDYSKVNKLSHKYDAIAIKTLLGYFGKDNVSDVTAQKIERYKASRRRTIWGGKQISGARVNRELAVLKAAFNKGIEWGMVLENPVQRVKFFSEKDRSRTRFLSPTEKKRLLAACPPSLRRFVLMALKTGMRKSELLDLKWKDINSITGVITLRKTKSGKLRHIPIHPDVEDMLKHIVQNGPYVFADRRGCRQSIHGATRGQFDVALETAGIRDFRFHDLRHTFASELVMKGADLMTVAELLGHSSTRMTERYSHLSPSHKSLAINLLGSEAKESALSKRRIVNT